jgi:hypothetical protein
MWTRGSRQRGDHGEVKWLVTANILTRKNFSMQSTQEHHDGGM